MPVEKLNTVTNLEVFCCCIVILLTCLKILALKIRVITGGLSLGLDKCVYQEGGIVEKALREGCSPVRLNIFLS